MGEIAEGRGEEMAAGLRLPDVQTIFNFTQKQTFGLVSTHRSNVPMPL